MKAASSTWILGSLIFSLSAANVVRAQIIPDDTLPENSRVEAGCTRCTIDGGTQQGNNLFHSFRDLSVPTGGEAFFNNAAEIENILTRVTGNSVSNIDGLLRSNGTANLFLLNPNGILFGSNARLDIGGSFVASTASSILLDNGFAFTATNPQAPPLLTVNAPVGLQYGTSPGSIGVQGTLQVRPGQTLALVGGEIRLEGGNLKALGGRVELGSVGTGSLVAITPINLGQELNYQGVQQFQDIRLTQAAQVNASGRGGGSIQVQGRRLSLTEGSRIAAVTEGTQAGRDFIIRAAESVEVSGFNPQNGSDSSSLAAEADRSATGDAGNLTIETRTLRVADGAFVSTRTLGTGNGGNLTVRARSVEVIGFNPQDDSNSFLSAQSGRGSTGNAGNVTIETGTLRLIDGGTVSTRTLGAGNGGNLRVQARSIEMIGFVPQTNSSSFLAAEAREGSTGDAGNLTIETRTLRVLDSAIVSTRTFGAGNGGDLTVRAQSVEVRGFNALDDTPSFLAADTRRGATGDAGNLTIETGTLRILDGGLVSANTVSAGDGGNLAVQARSVEVIGFDPQTGFSSSLGAQANTGSTGNAGNVTVETDILRVLDGGRVSTRTFGAGNSGDLTVRAQLVEVSGSNSETDLSSFLATEASEGETGNAGNLTIETGMLRVLDGGLISANTLGAGNGGNLAVQARSVEVSGFDPQTGFSSALAAQANTGSTGNAGGITLTTERLQVANRGEIRTTSGGTGSAGNIDIQAASQIILADNARISSNTNAREGNINLTTPLLLLRRGSSITTNASGIANGGNININARNGFVVALPNENSDIIASAEQGNGGRINITAQDVLGFQESEEPSPFSEINASSEFGTTGTIALNTPEVDPSRGLTEFPTDVVDASRLVALGCSPDAINQVNQGEFYQTGRGGIAPLPTDALSSSDILEDLQPPASWNTTAPSNALIREAQGWQVNDRGEVILLAEIPIERRSCGL